MRSPRTMPSALSPPASASTRSRSSRKESARSPWMTAAARPYTSAPRAIMSYTVNACGFTTNPRRLLADDVRLHGAERGQQLLLGLRVHVVLVERLDQVLDGGVPLRVGDLHPLMGALHVLAEVRARAAGRVADLIGELRLEQLHRLRLHALEALVHPGIGRHVGGEVTHHEGDALPPPQTLVQRGHGGCFLAAAHAGTR